MATSVVFPRVQFFADNGRLLIGGRIHTYIAGTSSRAPTYKDAARAQPNTNPIILDGRAEASIYLAEGVEYKFVVEDSNGALILTQEPVYGAIWPNAEDWPSDVTLAYQYMLEAKAAASAIGPIKFYDTYAQADGDLPNLSEDDLVEIAHDESRASSPRARYRVESGALVFVIEFDIFYPGMTGSVPRPIQSKLRDLISLDDYVDTAHAISAAIASSKKVYIPFDITIRIPTDAPSLQSAIDHTYVYPGVTATLLIQSGHKLAEGVSVQNGDYTNYTISSEDTTVYLDASWPVDQRLMVGVNARMPNWGIFVDCEGKVLAQIGGGAIEVNINSELNILDNCGATNGGGDTSGLFVYKNSKVSGLYAKFTNFGYNNVWITHTSDAHLELLTATGAGLYGGFVSRSSRAYFTGADFSGAALYGLEVRRSRVTAIVFGSSVPPKFNNCGSIGVRAVEGSIVIISDRETGNKPQFSNNPTHLSADRGSIVVANNCAFTQSSGNSVAATTGATVDVTGSVFTSVGASAIRATDARIIANVITAIGVGGSGINAQRSIVSAPRANLSNANTHGIYAYEGSQVSGNDMVLSGCGGAGIYVDAAAVVAPNANASGCGYGVQATNMGAISMLSGNVTGYTTQGIFATRGSRIMAHSASARKAGSDTPTDVVCGGGSTIIFQNGVGGTNITPNTFTASGTVYV